MKILFANIFLVLVFFSGLCQCLSNYPLHYYDVTDSLDFTPGSLRQQILNANADGTGGLIWNNIPLNQTTIYLQAPLPTITVDSLSIFDQSANWQQVIVDGGFSATDPVFKFSASAINSCVNNNGRVTYRNFAPTTFQVVNTNNSGTGSIREAILKSSVSDSKDLIIFNIPGISPHTINLLTVLQPSNPVIIDGSTQPANGYGGDAPKIELKGNGGTFNAMDFTSLGNPHTSFEVYGIFFDDFISGVRSYTPATNVYIGSNNSPNVFANCSTAIELNYSSEINITGNYIGTDTSGINPKGNIVGITLNHDSNILVSNNIISGNLGIGISLDGCYNSIIKGNKIGVNINDSNLANGTIGILYGGWWSELGQVGGYSSADQNTIANSPEGVAISSANNISILRNSIYGNTVGIRLAPGTNNNTPPPLITKANSDTISGTSLPLSRIELFYNVDSPISPQGKIYIGNTNADTSGLWQYIGALTDPCAITATQTDSGNTSEFSSISGAKVDLIEDTLICFGNSIILDAGPGFESYSWSTSDSTQTIVATNPGIYAVQTISPITHCPSSDTVQIFFDTIPPVSLINDTLICNTQSLILDGGAGYLSYQWQDSSTSQFFIASDTFGGQDTVVYFVSVVDSFGCASADSVTIVFDECLFVTNANNPDDALIVSPNPFHQKLLIRTFGSSRGNALIRILDGAGVEVFKKHSSLTEQEIDLGFLSNGTYTLYVTGEKINSVRKIIKD